MAQGIVGLILRARDEASATIRRVNAELGGITKVAGKLSGAFGLGGLGVSAILAAAAGVATLAQSYAKAVQEQDRLGLTMGKSRAEFDATSKEAAAFTLQLERTKRGWKDFTDELGRASLKPAAAGLQLLNQVGGDIQAGRWKELLVLYTEGLHTYQSLQLAHEKEREAADKAAAAQERERVVAEAALAIAKERAKRLDDLARAMRLARGDADALLNVLDRMDAAAKAFAMRQKVFKAMSGTRELMDLANPLEFLEATGGKGDATDVSPDAVARRTTRRRPLVPPVDRPIDFDFAARDRALTAWLKTISSVSTELANARENWRLLEHQTLSSVQLMRDATDSFAVGVQSGMATIASRLTDETQTIRSAWSTMVRAIEQEFLQMAARLAAAKILGLLATIFLPGIGAPAAAAATAMGGSLPGTGSRSLTRSRDAIGRTPPRTAGNTIIINLLDTKTLRGELMPGGALHRAQDQVRIGSRY